MIVNTNVARMTLLFWITSCDDRHRLNKPWPYLKQKEDLRQLMLRKIDNMPINLCNAVVTQNDFQRRLNRSVR